MTSERRSLPYLAALLLLVWANLNSKVVSTSASIFPESSSSPSTTSALPSTSYPTRTPAPSGVIIDEAGARRVTSNNGQNNNQQKHQHQQNDKTRTREPPGSPVKLFMPDEFQFYTLNANGQLVMKQMTKHEIQGMIAAGSGNSAGLPVDFGHHQTQLPDHEPKVSDVVHNVQKVLKDELNKPIQVPVSESSSSIPGSVNSQWTNMLPYILSGGSVDQQDIAQDTSIILPALEADQTYVDVVPLHNGDNNKHTETETNYIPVQSSVSEEQEIKLITPKPSSGKPISLLGNMALDSGIVGGQEVYYMPTKGKPNRPLSTPSYHKYTTTKPASVAAPVASNNVKNDFKYSGNKPTLYIPLSVSPSLLADAQSQDSNYGQSGNYGVYVVPEHVSRPSQERNSTKFNQPETNGPPKKTTTTTFNQHTNEPGFTRLPMIPVPVIEADKMSTSTQRTNPNQTPMFEILPTISPGSVTSSTVKEVSHPSKINVGPMGGFKKPDTSYKPSTPYRPIYEPTTKSSTTANIVSSSSSYQPVYESKPSTTSQTYRPVYEPPTKQTSTVKITETTSTYRPIYEAMTKPTTTNFLASSVHRPVYEAETKPSSSVTYKLTSTLQPISEASTLPSDRFKVTQYPSSTYYTTGKASTMSDAEMKTSTSTLSGVKVTTTMYPSTAYQTKGKDSVTEFVTKPSSVVVEVTKSSVDNDDDMQKSTVKNEEKKPTVPVVSKVEPNIETKTTEKIKTDDYIPLNGSAQVIGSESSTVSSTINNEVTNTVSYPDSKSKLPEKVFDTTDKNDQFYTTLPDKNEVESETPTLLYYNTEKTIMTDEGSSDQQQVLLKTESYELNEDSTLRPTVAAQDAKTESFDYHTFIPEVTTKEPEIMLKQTDGVPAETTETVIIPTTNKQYEEMDGMKLVQTSQKDDVTTDDTFESTTRLFVPLEESAIKYNASEAKKPASTTLKQSNDDKEEEPTTMPPKDSTTDKAEYGDSTKMYDLPIDSIVNYLSDQLSNEKKAEILIPSADQINSNEPVFTDIRKDEIEVTTDNYQPIKVMTESTSKPTTLEKDNVQKVDSTKEKEVTPVYEKMETITESRYTEITLATKESIKKEDDMQEDEMSTVKVIPVYDDDSVMYTLPPDTQSTVKYPTPSAMSTTIKPTVQINDVSSTLSSSSYAPENKAPSADLPGLHETLNNYMKEHYDTKSPTTDNYDELLSITTLPTVANEDSVGYKKLPSTIFDYLTTNLPEYEKVTKKPQIDTLSTILPSDQNTEQSEILSFTTQIPMEDTKESKPESPTTNIILQENITTEDTEKQMTTMEPEASEKTKVETPIIYIELTSPKPEEQITSHQQPNEEQMIDSSLTRIKTKNPIAEIDKLISEAPAFTNVPTIVPYILPSENLMPNNIASGLIAGYPTYNKSKPIAEYMTSSTKSQDDVIVTSTTSEPIQMNTQDNKEKEVDKSTSKPSEIQTTVSTNDQSTSPQPLESLPLANYSNKNSSQTEGNDDQINSSFIPPLEKISDLINQLKNSPDDDNSVATTIVPLDNYETLLNESNAKINASTASTLESSTQTSVESQSSTYVMLPTLPAANYTNKTVQSSTKPLAPSTTAITSEKIEATTQQISKTEPTSTMKQVITEKPHTTLAYRTTKGPIEKVQSTIDKSAGRINLEEEKIKMQQIKPTEPTKYTMKNKFHFGTRRPVNEAHSSFTRKATKPVKLGTTISAATTTTTTTAATISITSTTTERITIKPTEDPKDEKWTLIPQKGIADQPAETKKDSTKEGIPSQNSQIVPLDHASDAISLDQSNKGLDKDVAEFLNVCNELSFKFWTLANNGLSSTRSVTMSPFGMISTLAMIFLGARGTTSNQMNDILKLDDVVTFNPHLVFQNITDTVTLARGQGIENAAFVRALFADRLKVRRIMPFYKEQAQQFYEGAVVDINFSTAGDILRRRTNLLIRKQTGGRIKDFVKSHTVPLRSPLTALSANVFQTSCDGPDASSEGRDGEMYFALAQTVKQRKLVPIPAVVWKSGVSAGYEPSLDATAVALGDPKRPVSMIMILPGQQGVTAPGDNLERLESRLFGSSSDALEKLLKVVIPRRVEVQMPKFSHRSIVNVTSALKKMGFEPLFTKIADLKGINGAGHDLFLADMLQMNLFCTCGDENKLGNRHLSETYPGTSSRHTRTWEIINNSTGIRDNLDNRESDGTEAGECDDADSEDSSNDEMVNNLRQKVDKKRIRWFMPSGRRRCRNRRQAEPEKPRMKIDKPFLYLIRHNLTGLILHIGRFNPKTQS